MAAYPERSTPGWRRTLGRTLETTTKLVGYLVLPLSLLLFLQWPLRELIGAYSREANDVAQCLFALYMSVAVVCATRAGAHLATDAVAFRYSVATRTRLVRIASLAIVVPGSLFVLWTAWPIVRQSVLQLEAFPETFNPGYFIVKTAVMLLALGVLAQALVDGVGGAAAARD
jgi:TRAP-type mannitol/chloroaromatic compound transport system permease small subunit